MQKSKYWKYSKAFSMFLLITIKTWSHLSADLECKWFPSIYTVCFEIQAQQNFKMTQDVHPFIHGRFIETFSLKWIIFQNDANRPTLHLWALHQIILFKMNRVSKWRKTSTPPSIGALSRLSLSYFNMMRTFRLFICGRWKVRVMLKKWFIFKTKSQ